MSIGKRIREVRNGAGLRQDDFALACDVSPRAFIAYELDERDPPSSFVLTLFKNYKTDPLWLLSGEGSKSKTDFNRCLESSIIAVRSFLREVGGTLPPEKEAKLILLLAEYFSEGGHPGSSTTKRILENAL